MNDDLSLLLNSLNDPQRQAVAAPLGRQLVLAGAGSGKTRVLVHRIAWLIQVEHASPYSILSVTFTNKAAAEMRHRIEQLLGINPAGMWVGTFHGLAHRLLRAHWREAGLSENFQILDSDDQQRLVKRVIRELGLDEQRWPARQAQWFINGQKDEGLRPQHIQPGGDLFLATMLKIYEAYEAACARAGVIDFSELLLRALDLWRDHPGVLEHYQRRFRHILVDEFQDTNAVQYAWLRILAKGGDSLMVVGDDDQSIYGWRGARIENIQQFSDDFADAEVIRLEQNYRSTASILKAANALIANNQGRLGKELWTDGEDGESLSLYAAFNEHDEARYVVESIESALKGGLDRVDSDFATFIRTLVILVTLGGILAVLGKFQAPGSILPRSWLFLVLSGLATGASWICYFRALKLGPASLVAPLDKFSVVLVALLGVAFLGERLDLRQWLGVALVTAGVVVLAIRP
ncbi:TPA: UvrD-helicase domain-containing protein [Pseudomonas aeruginosa]